MQVMNSKTYMAKSKAGEKIKQPFYLCDAIGDGEVVDETDPRFVEVMDRQTLQKLATEFYRMCKEEGVTLEHLDIRKGAQHWTLWEGDGETRVKKLG